MPDDKIQYVPTVKLFIEEDVINSKPAKAVTFEKNVKADLLETFILDCLEEKIENFTSNYYTDCDKGKMFGKFYTLCDTEHQQWNAS